MKVLSGTSNVKLSKEIAKLLKVKLVNTNIIRFAMVKYTLRLTKILEEIVFLLFNLLLIQPMII